MSEESHSQNQSTSLPLLRTWETMSSLTSSDKLLELANLSLKQGEVLLAQDILRKARKEFSEISAECATTLQLEIEEKYLLSLARLGNQQRVVSRIEDLIHSGVTSESLFGLAGRCHKDLYFKTGEQSHLQHAFDHYHQGFLNHHRKSYYLGVNAASCAYVLGKREAAEDLARLVLSLIHDLDSEDSTWKTATRGECLLLLDRLEEAATAYTRASEQSDGSLLDRTSMRRQARWILEKMGRARETLDDCFKIGPLMVFAGHLPDSPERHTARFPESSYKRVEQSILTMLSQHSPELAYTSAAAGADLIFIDCLLEQSIPYHLVLPCPPNEFRKLSVSPFGETWEEKFETALLKAESVRQSSHREAPATETAWTFSSQCLAGFSLLHASSNSLDLMPAVVWDSETGKPGGTESFVHFWSERGNQVLQILPDSGKSHIVEQAPPPAGTTGQSAQGEKQQVIRAMVFADVKGYTGLGDLQIPPFVNEFMGEVAKVIEQGNFTPLSINTWGDAIYGVFETTAEAGNFCVSLMKNIESTHWEEKGLPKGITFRIACHAGPVHEAIDPVTQRKSFFGVHVSQTARIEPITPPGMIYASEEFSALAMMEDDSRFSSEFIGHLPLAKGFGSLRIYNLNPA